MVDTQSAYNVGKGDKIIAVMGPTRSGKSKLIDTLAKTSWATDGLQPATPVVQAIRTTPPGLPEIVLVDTPGFDDDKKSDLEILQMIADWLKNTYERGITLTGILYLHRISDNRITRAPERNLRMLGKLCGTEPAKKVIFVTTMWDTIVGTLGNNRELELKTKYFKPMLDLGAGTAPFINTLDSACQIISQLLQRDEEQKVTLIQEEMVDIGRELPETAAAAEVLTDMQKMLIVHKQTIEALKREAEKADNQQMLATLNKDLADNRRRMETTFKEAQKLKIPWSRRFKRLFASKPKQKPVNLQA